MKEGEWRAGHGDSLNLSYQAKGSTAKQLSINVKSWMESRERECGKMKEKQYLARELQEKEGKVRSWTKNGNYMRDENLRKRESCAVSACDACVSLCRGFKLNKCFQA